MADELKDWCILLQWEEVLPKTPNNDLEKQDEARHKLWAASLLCSFPLQSTHPKPQRQESRAIQAWQFILIRKRKGRLKKLE